LESSEVVASVNRRQVPAHPEPETTPEQGIVSASDPGPEEPWRPHQVPSVRILSPTESPSRHSEPATQAGASPEAIADEGALDAGRGSLPGASRILGVNIVGTIAYLALVEAPAQPLLDLADVLMPDSHLELSAQLADFSKRFARLLTDLEVGAVVVARPLHYTNWRYNDAAERVALETCCALEAHRRGARFESVGQHHAANVVGLPLDRCGDLLPGKLGIERTSRWADRAPALLVAMASGVDR
jgi:hypothetical protein